jgi:hypothetical protein
MQLIILMLLASLLTGCAVPEWIAPFPPEKKSAQS